MIQREYGEAPSLECRHDSHEVTDKQKRYRQILLMMRDFATPMTAYEIAEKMYICGIVDRIDRNYVSPRMTEMCKDGICEPVGKKFCEESNRMVTAFQIRKAM